MKTILKGLKRRWGALLLPAALAIALTGGSAGAAPLADPNFDVATPILNPADLQKYVTQMPNAYALEVAPDKTTFSGVGEDYYRIDMGQFNHDMGLLLAPAAVANYPAANPATNKLPLTPTWGYGYVTPGSPPGTPGAYTYPGPTIVNTQGTPTRVTWTNSLPAKNVVSIDPTLHCDPLAPNCAPENRTVVHVHGAHVWDDSDGDPLAWFSNGFAKTGETWRPNTQFGPVGTYRYINDQEAGTIWYHDHAIGQTHVNVYAGLAGFFLITDANEASLRSTATVAKTLPNKAYEVPIALQDRTFFPDGRLALPNNPVLDTNALIPNGTACGLDTLNPTSPYACVGTATTIPNNSLCDPYALVNDYMCPAAQFSKAADGSLIPYDPTITDVNLVGPFTAPSITAEFFGNVSVANGKVWPLQNVEPRMYRYRLLNGCDSRTYFLKFNDPNLKVWRIGTDQAFLKSPVDVTNQFMVLMPGERIDILVDFKTKSIAGTRLLLENYGPYDPVANADFPWDGVPPLAVGVQPINQIIPDVLAFDVVTPLNTAIADALTPSAQTPPTLNAGLTTYPSPALVQTSGLTTANPIVPGTSTIVPDRKISLIERLGSHGRLMLTLDARDFMDINSPVTELPKLNSTEIWEVANLTPDAHPIHLHLVAFQILDRQEIAFIEQVDQFGLPLPSMPYTAPPPYQYVMHDPVTFAPLVPTVASTPVAPAPEETGWKDTIQMLPGTVTRIIAKFDLPGMYVWHCHILSHEENDMMRALMVTTPAAGVTATLSRNGVPLASNTEPPSLATPLTITAQATTGLATGLPPISLGYEYKFSVTNPAGATSILQDFTPWIYPMIDSYLWTPPTNAPGTYTIRVDAREIGTVASQANTLISYTIDATPPVSTATPAPGTFAGSVNVTLSANEAATIYYTIDGTTPTTASPVYTGAIPLTTTATASTTITVKFFAVDLAGNTEAAVNSAAYTITDATPPTSAAAPAVGNYSGSVTVTLTASETAVIYYTTDGSTPTTASTVYISPFLLSSATATTITVKFFAVDLAGNTETTVNSVAYNLQPDTTPPVSSASPPAGTYAGSVDVTLSANEAATIYYTIDGTTPTTASSVYVSPITLASTTTATKTVKFFAVDLAGNVETPVKSAIYNLHVADLVAKVAINNGSGYTNSLNAKLSLSATDPVGIKAYAISTDNVTYLPTVTINPAVTVFSATNVPVTLPAGDGIKTVYVKFTDNLDVVYPPVSDTIILETMLPTVVFTPTGGDYGGKILVSLVSPNEPEGVNVYYTTDGTTPTTASKIYRNPFTLGTTPGTTVTVKAFAKDFAGNVGTVQSMTYRFVAQPDMTASVNINNNAKYTNTPNVTLKVVASDPIGGGVGTMSFSNDGVNYTPPVAYVPTLAMPWTLDPNNGLKTVYFRLTDKGTTGVAPITYTFTSSIILANGVKLASGDCNGDNKVDLKDVYKALLASTGLAKLTIPEQARCDVAPLLNGKPDADGQVDSGDAYVVSKKVVGLITF